MKIDLKPEQEQFIQSQLMTGKYESAEQVIDEALQLLEKRNHQEAEKRLEELRQKIAVANEQIAMGQVMDGETVLEQLQEKLRLDYSV